MICLLRSNSCVSKSLSCKLGKLVHEKCRRSDRSDDCGRHQKMGWELLLVYFQRVQSATTDQVVDGLFLKQPDFSLERGYGNPGRESQWK